MSMQSLTCTPSIKSVISRTGGRSTFYCSSKSLLYQYVDELRRKWGINYSSYPLNTIFLCESSNKIVVAKHLFDNKGLCGIAMLGDKTDTVILNANRSEREQNFDCGHELMHLSKHRNIGEDCFQCFAIPQPEQNELLEWEANEGSAELLVPYRLILPLVKKAYPSLTNRNAYKQFQVDLSWKFGVSMPVIYYRFESLKYEIAQYNAGVSLKDIEILSKSKLLQKGMHIRSLNDMFNIAS